jgi:hypothetical protein
MWEPSALGLSFFIHHRTKLERSNHKISTFLTRIFLCSIARFIITNILGALAKLQLILKNHENK